MKLALFVLRMRSGFEAADSGILIWRAKPLLLLLFFGIPAFTILIVTRAFNLPFYVHFGNELVLRFLTCVLALWWLKPLFDRCALQVVSKLFFNRDSTIKELCFSLFKNGSRGLVGDLLWRRFSPVRGAALAMRILEKPTRKQYKERKKILVSGGLNFGIYLTIICVILEAVLAIGIYIFLYSVLMLTNTDFPSVFSDALLCNILLGFYFINYVLVETLYIAMSFALYINSRVITEGWDLEIIFRQLTKKNEAGRTHE
ncbi:MAG: hypothetical protein LBT01_08345 [Spirochaetaceae bacterium]|nr:hypothetical protein [Spirochaetaceae bacterium]